MRNRKKGKKSYQFNCSIIQLLKKNWDFEKKHSHIIIETKIKFIKIEKLNDIFF